MSSIVTDQGVVHYEVTGRGKPVILLHGWLGSWGYWIDTLTCLESRFRGYALDFWGFGDSGKQRESFHISDFVALVDQFMERLGIESAPIIGHSMGGTVALSLALTRPERVQQVVVVGSPIVGDSLSIWLRLAGKPWVAHALWKIPFLLQTFLKLYSPFVTQKPGLWHKMVVRDASATTLESFFSSIRSLRYTDLTPRLKDLSVPAMGIYGLQDVIVDPHQAKLLSQYAPHSHVTMLPHSGHFPMLDEPEHFNQQLLRFLTHHATS
ncbi:MAG: alpha/beta hydrolase [Caldilineae bacterium]|nr:MAG: alpha/beta hydrolase [Caldilineae bacterium]